MLLSLLIELRNKIKNQIFFIEQIICQELEIDAAEYENIDKQYLLNRLQYLNNYYSDICENIKQTCVHDYIYDDIDITLDHSMRIKYCSICETTG